MADINERTRPVYYSYANVTSPFQNQGQTWDYPLGQWRHVAAFWRKICLGMLCCSCLLALWFLYLLSQPSNRVMVAQINHLGVVQQLNELQMSKTVHDQVLVEAFIQQYLFHWYQLPIKHLDKSVMSNDFMQAYSSTSVKRLYTSDQPDETRAHKVDGLTIMALKPIGHGHYYITYAIQRGAHKTVMAAQLKLSKLHRVQGISRANPMGFMVDQIKFIDHDLQNKTTKQQG